MTVPVVAMGSSLHKVRLLLIYAALTIFISASCAAATDSTLGSGPLPPAPLGYRYYHFNIEFKNVTVNCQTKSIITVNGQFPGPVIFANEGDRIVVNVTNSSPANMTIHFHGVRQNRTTWMDGVAYITQCPIQARDYFTHDFTIPLQRGTLLWHAHINWQRATVHGAFITYPKLPYPYPVPHKEFPVILAEWWYGDVEQIENLHLAEGNQFPPSDAMTINGQPGPTYNCSASEGVSTLEAAHGKTYLLRIVNAALNTHLFFAVANHTLTVVEADGEYVQPFEAPRVLISPGQTTNVLLTANQEGGTYYMSVTGYGRDNIPSVRPTALFQYRKPSPVSDYPFAPILPAYNDTAAVLSFTSALRTLYPGRVPLTVNRKLFFTVGLANRVCGDSPATNCTNPPYFIQGAINNVTFLLPKIAILQASHFNIPGVFTEDFPDYPPIAFDYTGPFSPPPVQRVSQGATRIVPINFNDTVQLVLQNTMIFGFEDHPFHLHGHNFYILAQGLGNYDETIDSLSFNLYDPPLRNTVGVPFRGWTAIRIKMNNPGVWLFHCHFDKHTSWGMQTVFHVHNGAGPNDTYNPPPSRLMPC